MNSRNQALDVLRGIAILLVICDHFPLFTKMMSGWIGVDLFFVLSGFLISGLLFKDYKATGKIHIGRFLLRRGLKIWPALYTYLAATMLLTIAAAPKYPLKGFAASALFVSSYYPRFGPIYIGHTWSLSVEEHFYIVLPILLALLVVCSKRTDHAFDSLPAIFAALVVLCLVGRLITPTWIIVNRASHLRADSLFCGVYLGYLFHFRPEIFQRFNRAWLLVIAAVLIAPAFVVQEESFFMHTIGLTFMLLGCGLVVAWSVQRAPSRNRIIRAVAWIGLYSYSIYLWHRLFSFIGLLPHNRFVGFSFYVAASILFGALMSKAIEIPVLKIRDRLIPDAKNKSEPILGIEVALDGSDLGRA